MSLFPSLSLVLVACLLGADGFQTGPCDNTPQCHCKWSEGKRLADCSNQGFQSIPDTLSSDIQTLVLDGNPLRKLDKDAFKTVGLLNIQTLSVRRCRIEFLDDNAFRDLKIMTHLDLSHNNITKLFPKTFDGNDGLKTIKMSHNPITKLVSYQFPPLRSLKAVDLSHCRLDTVDKTSFKNLGASVESILLDNNMLQTLREEVFTSLLNLKALTLHSNPWTCDCKLKNFRDYVVSHKLYNRPTKCSEPSRLYNKMWDEIAPAEFACKPELLVPFGRVFGAPGVDAMLSCRIMGSPVPQARWVVSGRIVNNNTHPAPFADQTWLIHEEKITYDGVERWYNLTITNPGINDLGEYLCVAENNGGVMERTVTLTFDDPSTYGGGIPVTDEQLTIIIGASVAVLVLLVLLVIICCYCLCKKQGKKKTSNKEKEAATSPDSQKLLSPQQQVTITGHSQSTALLSNGMSPHGNGNGTLTKARSLHHHIDYHSLPQSSAAHHLSHQQLIGYIPAEKFELDMHTLRQPLRAPSVISNSNKTTGSSGSNGSEGGRTTASISRASFADDPHGHVAAALGAPTSFPPDLLVIKPNSVSPNSMHQLNPAGLIQLTPVSSSAFTRSGTLPLPQNRSLSCDHSNSSSPIPHLLQAQPAMAAGAPPSIPIIHHHHHHPMAPLSGRPGYVTLPRRPRASWSVPREQPSPSSASLRGDREPIYDGIGPRTSADGSSRLNLNKSQLAGQAGTPSSQQPGQRFALPPYCAPIEEISELPIVPKESEQKMQNGRPQPAAPGLPNGAAEINGGVLGSQMKPYKPSDASIGTSSSEQTLLEENISAYCEPFGKALKPTKEEEVASRQSAAGNRTSLASVESELDLVVSGSQKKGCGTATSTPLRLNGASPENHSAASPLLSTTSDSMPPPPQPATVLRKAGPKTLPKPKVKPVPPPKPKKSFQENGTGDSSATPLIAFQDESVDGSEV